MKEIKQEIRDSQLTPTPDSFDPVAIKVVRRNASDPKISLDKLPFGDMFMVRDDFSNSDESDTQ